MILDQEFSLLALGDSYTIGESVEENERWPVQLADSLRNMGYQIADPIIVAQTGWTTDELQRGIANTQLDTMYDFVFLLIGVNNQYRGRPVSNYIEEFSQLLDQAIVFSGGNKDHVFVISIPDWGVMPFAAGRDQQQIAEEIDIFNAAKKEETQKRDITFINITPISRNAAKDLSLVANDGLHPSGKMYTEWVKLIIPVISTRF